MSTARGGYVTTALRILAAVLLLVVVDLVAISPLQHSLAQHRLRDQLRTGLSSGSLPRGPFQVAGSSLEPTDLGQPVALLQVPAIGLDEVVVEGTGARETAVGAGHKRDTVLPGQRGTSVMVGRAAAYGGCFRRISELSPGAPVLAVTSQGRFTYRVVRVRRTGDPAPAPKAGAARMTLVTAEGRAFAPQDLLRVDTELVSKPVVPLGLVSPGAAPADERPMAGASGSSMIGLVFLVQLLTAAAAATLLSWRRWGRRQTWVVATPLLLGLGLVAANQITFLLPNVL